jgi:23S rRNA (cytidine2498-2'-O)-methyltransferase
MHCLLTDDQSEAFLLDELRRAYSTRTHEQVSPRWVRTDAPLDIPLAFCRQALPNTTEVSAASINAWATLLLEATINALPQDQPWQLQIVACYGQAHEGLSRCEFIRKAFHERLQKKRRALLRTLQTDTLPLSKSASLVQLYLTSPESGYISVSVAPLPFDSHRNVWPFDKGELPIASDKAAPSRAFAKLVESEQRLGIRIEKGDTVVDLGACPGSWTYVAVHRGAKVISVDRSPLRDDLMEHPRITFVQGDAFKYTPPQPVAWLICDVIATPDRSIALLLEWVKTGRCRKFIVSLKFKGSEEYAKIDQLKAELPALCSDFYLARLCANKNEVCAFGVVI